MEFSSGDVIFTEIETYSETTTEEILNQVGFSSEPFFIGMKIGGIALIVSLGVAMIIKIFKSSLS